MQAGIGKSIITPKSGAELMGYGKRVSPAQGIHDDLYARALVLKHDQVVLAFCSVELCYLRAHEARQIREAVANRCDLAPENIFIATTHTHSGPGAHHPDNWDRPFSEIVADAIIAAYHNLQPARIGIGAGILIGYGINRRWLDRPTDPFMGVIRVDASDGKPLAVVGNFACHAVVMGYDNLLGSGDWPGYASRILEQRLGGGALALFTQGGAGDINPLTETVRQKLAAGYPVGTIGMLTSYYGDLDESNPEYWNIEDRAGGTFVECATLAHAYTDELLRVWEKIETQPDVPLWIERVMVDGMVGPDEPPPQPLPEIYQRLLPDVAQGAFSLEIMLAGIGGSILCGQPGESFSEIAVEFRKRCQQLGYSQAMLVTYANGSYGYLPPENAFNEGGYEVDWPRKLGISRYLQNRIQAAIQPILEKHQPG